MTLSAHGRRRGWIARVVRSTGVRMVGHEGDPAEASWDALALPTPLALVALRARRAGEHDAKERFDSLSYLSEALLKYVVLSVHTCMAALDENSWLYWGYQLAHTDSLGGW